MTRIWGRAGTSTTETIGAGNQVLSDGTYWYQYDAEGNRALRYVWTDLDSDGQVDADEQSQITQYTWDQRNRLVEVTDRDTLAGSATQVVDLVYDVHNRWIGETVDADGDGPQEAQSTHFVYDGQQIVLQFESSSPLPLAGEGQGEGGENESAALQLTHRYLWGAAVDQLLADEQIPATAQGQGGEGQSTSSAITQPGNVVWALSDQLGTVRDLAQLDAATGLTQVVNHRVYDSFGQLTSETNAAVDCLFGFTGRPLDQNTGLQNNVNRWYDAKAGRWVSEDPIQIRGGDGNTYRYVGNSPPNVLDSTGLAEITYSDKKRILSDVDTALQRLVDSGQMTSVEKAYRYNIVKYAITSPAYWGGDVSARGARYWLTDPAGYIRLKPDADPFAAYRSLWTMAYKSLPIGCYRACGVALVRAALVTCKQQLGATEFGVLSNILNLLSARLVCDIFEFPVRLLGRESGARDGHTAGRAARDGSNTQRLFASLSRRGNVQSAAARHAIPSYDTGL